MNNSSKILIAEQNWFFIKKKISNHQGHNDIENLSDQKYKKEVSECFAASIPSNLVGEILFSQNDYRVTFLQLLQPFPDDLILAELDKQQNL